MTPATALLDARVLCLRSRLDRDLAGGAAPWLTPAHERWAQRLAGGGMRRQLAATLETVLENAEEPPGPTAAAPLDREAVLGSRRAIVALVARLRDPRPVRPQGVAMVRRLLVDATGPLYRHQPAAATLAGVLDVALRALEPLAELRLAA